MDLRDDTCNVRMFEMLRVHLISWLKIQFISDIFLLVGLQEYSMQIWLYGLEFFWTNKEYFFK